MKSDDQKEVLTQILQLTLLVTLTVLWFIFTVYVYSEEGICIILGVSIVLFVLDVITTILQYKKIKYLLEIIE